MDLSLTVDDVSRIVRPKRVAGKTTAAIRRIAALAEAQPGDLSFLANRKYRPEVSRSRASLIFVPVDFDGEPAKGQVFFFQENTTLALARICAEIERTLWPRPSPGIHPSAVVAATAQVAESATLGPLCVVEEGSRIGERTVLEAAVCVGRECSIGDDCWLQPNVSLMGYCQVGSRVRLQSGVVLGSDGYGYDTSPEGRHEKLPQVGNVVIGDDVEIGANTTVDRARFDRTEIGEGTKIDNLVQIGHNAVIGKHCLIVAQVGIAGSTVLEDNVVLGGQVGVAGHLRIGAQSMVAAQSGLAKDLPPKSRVMGSPAVPIMLEQKLAVLRVRLPDLFRRVDTLEAAVKRLSSPA